MSTANIPTEVLVEAAEALVKAEAQSRHIQLLKHGGDEAPVWVLVDDRKPITEQELGRYHDQAEALGEQVAVNDARRVLAVAEVISKHVWARAIRMVLTSHIPDVSTCPPDLLELVDGMSPVEAIVQGATQQREWIAALLGRVGP